MNIKNIKEIDGGKFEIYFSYIDDLTGKRRRIRRRFTCSLPEAIEHRDRLKQAAKSGNLGKEQQAEKPLSKWIANYIKHKEGQGLRSSSVKSIRHALSGVMKTGAADWRPEHIEAHHLDQWIAEQMTETDLSPSTISKRLGYLKRLIKHARKRLGLTVGFLRDVEGVSGSTRRKGRALTPEQARQFLEGMKQDYPQHYALCFVLLATGQRFGSVSALRWSDVADGWLTFSRSQYRGEIDTGSKTGKTIRIPVTDAIRSVLDWHRQWMVREQHPNVDHPDGLIFPTMTPARESATGGYRVAGDLRYAFEKVCDVAEIDPITPHDLRRTFNSWASEKVSGTVLRSITGHSSAEMTDHYYHGSREAKSGVVTSITDLIGT